MSAPADVHHQFVGHSHINLEVIAQTPIHIVWDQSYVLAALIVRNEADDRSHLWASGNDVTVSCTWSQQCTGWKGMEPGLFLEGLSLHPFGGFNYFFEQHTSTVHESLFSLHSWMMLVLTAWSLKNVGCFSWFLGGRVSCCSSGFFPKSELAAAASQ